MAATAVIFDLDGTVWDSLPFYAAALASGDPNDAETAVDQLAASPAATLLKRAGYTPARYRSHCEDNTPVGLYPDGLEVLGRLRDDGVPLGVVTNLPAWMAHPMLARHHLTDVFGSVVTAGRARPGKPHPAPLLLCCEELDVGLDRRCWYVGDSLNDCKAALAADVSFAWASWGYGATAPPGAHVTLAAFADVAAL